MEPNVLAVRGAGQSAEEWLKTHTVDIIRERRKSADRFTISGPERLTKIVPVIADGVYWHPQPNPVPQWRLTEKTTFIVDSFYRT